MKEDEYGDGLRDKGTRQIHPRSDFFHASWSTIKESRAETPRLQRDQNLSKALRHPVRFLLGACGAGKASGLIGCNGRGREAENTSGAEDQYKMLPVLPKMRRGT